MSKVEERHCPNCHENVEPRTWLCGCLRCPECGHCFRPCIPSPEFVTVNKGVCSECGEPIIEYKVKA